MTNLESVKVMTLCVVLLCIFSLHAEENALLLAGYNSIKMEETSIYSTSCPCLNCAKKIIQMGISKVYYNRTYSMDTEVFKLFDEASIKYNRIDTSLKNLP